MSSGGHIPLAEVIRVASSGGAPERGDRSNFDHLQLCEECRLAAEGYAALRKVVRELPRPEPPEALRKQVAELAQGLARDALARRSSKRRRLVVAGVAIAVAVTSFVALQWGRSRSPSGIEAPTPAPFSAAIPSPSDGQPSGTRGPKPAFVSKNRSFEDAQAVRAALGEDPTVSAFRQYYKASDVGSNQREMQLLLGELAGAVKGRTPAECMNAVLRGVPRATLPAYVERAHFARKDAWLMVFVYAPDTAPDTPLTGVMFYAMAVDDCTFLATAFWA